jgi:glycolate oxidase FAD binding subunit
MTQPELVVHGTAGDSAPRRPLEEGERAERVHDAFGALLGPAGVGLTRGLGRGVPAVLAATPLLLPGSEEEVAACLRLATEKGWQILPAGAGSWLFAGNPRPVPAALLSVSRLDRIVQYEPADLTLSAGAGLSLAGVARVVSRERQWLPMDPPGTDDGTLGGTLATGSAGGLALAYGAPRDLVLGLRIVTGDGRVLRFGGGVVKNVAGFDLVKLAVGSWGTLGVITETSFRLFPQPQRELFLVGRAGGLADLLAAARRAVTAPFVPAGVALLERPEAKGVGAPRSAVLIIRLVGAPERVEQEARVLEARLRPLPLARSEGEGAEGAALLDEIRQLEDGGELAVRMSLPASELPTLVTAARSAGRLGTGRDELARSPYRVAMDALGGSLRLVVPHVRLDPPFGESWSERLRELRATLEVSGGGLTVLHGAPDIVGTARAWGDAGGAGVIMERLKAQFDPGGILPPGGWT